MIDKKRKLVRSMNKIFLLTLILGISIFAQPGNRPAFPQNNLFPFNGVISFPESDSTISSYYLCKVPNSLLVFEKTGTQYKANFRLQAEVYDSKNNLITRNQKNNSVVTEIFEETNNRNMFHSTMFKFQLKPGQYEIRTIVTDLNSDRDLKLKPELFNSADLINEKIFSPIIISDKESYIELYFFINID